jgi:hypothetical protein
MPENQNTQGQQPAAQSNVLSRLFSSRKFVVLLVAIAAIVALVIAGRASFEQLTLFLTVTVPTFLGATALEDAAHKTKPQGEPVTLFTESGEFEKVDPKSPNAPKEKQ